MRGEVCILGQFVLRWHNWAGIWRRMLLVFGSSCLKEGHAMKTTEEKMSIIHLENNHRKINTLETAFSIWSLQVCLFYYGYFQGVLRTWFLLLFSFHFMTFLKNMFREFGFPFCLSEVFPMFFKSCDEISVSSSYIKFVAVGACHI